jgi:multidrug efflux system membrane fusion protein
MTGATLVPNPAIQLGASGNFVYLLDDSATVSKRDVAIGPTDGKHTVITSGLKAGDRVVIDGVDRLRDGAKVKVVDNPPVAAAQGSGQGQDQAGGRSAAEPAGPVNGEGRHQGRRGEQPNAGEVSPASGGASSIAPAPSGPATQSRAPGATKRGAAQ